jgi:2-polyprenyl-6-methoxyphenol hydroxylase-like FAD-dependent oxidoreductase
MHVLISGASIAGPALAHQLHQQGHDVTVVEQAPALRGGYPIDIRGTAIEVVSRMGLLPRLTAAHVNSRRITFLAPDGTPIAAVRPEEITGGVAQRDLEVRRGDLATALHDLIRDDVEFRFRDSVAELREHADGVSVEFRSGARAEYDLVVGADGLHSKVRELAFGPEERFHHYLGRCFAGFTVPNTFGLSHEGVLWNQPGRAAVLYAAGGADEPVHGFLTFTRADAPVHAFRNPAAQRDLVAERFRGDGWLVPELVAAMRTAEDLFFDVVSQIRMPSWHTDRIVLVGDAAHAPSFLSGQGSSIALVGAYLLADELSRHESPAEAFAAYQSGAAEFVARNQALATGGGLSIAPTTQEELDRRNTALRHPELLPGHATNEITSALRLPAPREKFSRSH